MPAVAPPSRPAPRIPRPLLRPRWVLPSLAAAALAWAGVHAAVDRPSVRAWARARVQAALETQLGPVDLGPEVRFDGLFRVSFGPFATRPGSPGADPALRVERVRVRASLPALLAGRLEPASIRLYGVVLAAGEGLAVRPGGGRPDAASPGRAGPLPTVHFRDLTLLLPGDGAALEVGPLDGRIAASRGDSRLRLDLALSTRDGGRGAAEIERGPSALRARLHLERIGPETFPALRGGPVALEKGTLAIDVDAEGPADLSRVDTRVRLAADGVVLRGVRLAPEPVGPMRFEASGRVSLDRRLGRAVLRDGEVTLLGVVRAEAAGQVSLGPDPTFALSLDAREVDYRALLEALPRALAPPGDAPRPGGTFSTSLAAAGPLLRPAEWSLEASLDLSRMREVARRAPPVALRAPFVHGIPADGGEVPLLLGPGSPDFVPLADLPEHVVRAVTTSEDAGFFWHAGFDFEEIRNALAAASDSGRVVRGGSTISQQLAKNLFLTRERTLARKVREAAVTVALEATVPKNRLLEIYLNVIEWGPGIHGIGPAARHWFGKDARDLSPGEAAFLASVIPNPVRYHAMLARGEPSPAWRDRVDALLLKMSEHGTLSDEELLRALDQPILFAGS